MFGTCIHLAMANLTQVERLGSKTRAYQLAVLHPPSKELHVDPHGSPTLPYREITYPLYNGQDPRSQSWNVQNPIATSQLESHLPAASKNNQAQLGGPNGSARLPSSDPNREISPVPADFVHSKDSSMEASNIVVLQSPRAESSVKTQQGPLFDDGGRHAEIVSSRDLTAVRKFAVLPMETGENPWDLGSPLLNLETVMGRSLFDYVFPFRRSPCCNHEDPESHYSLGPAVDRIKSKYHFMSAEDIRVNGSRRRPGRHSLKD
jgi:palmitoyltransferase